MGSLKGRLGPPTVIFQVEHNALAQSFLENTLAKSMNHEFVAFDTTVGLQLKEAVQNQDHMV